MIISFVRTLILLAVIVIAVRVMGKRQIGQLQPAELVVTILLSEIAATPMQDNDIPMLNTIAAILVLVSFEIILSAVSMKSLRFRNLLQGNSIVVIRDGKIEENQLRRLRFTVDDLLEALRQKDVFDITEVKYAIAETNGSLSVMLRAERQTVTLKDIGIKSEDNGMPEAVIIDGRTVKDISSVNGYSKEDVQKKAKEKGIDVGEVFLMTADGKGNTVIQRREKRK